MVCIYECVCAFVFISYHQRKLPCNNQLNCWLSHEPYVKIMGMKSGLS